MTPIESLRAALGDDCIRTGTDIGARHQGDWLVKAGPDDVPLALALPRDTQDVSTVLRICHAAGIPVVPQGGLTGLTGGAVPVRGAVLLSLERLRAIEEVDPIAGTITVQAGEIVDLLSASLEVGEAAAAVTDAGHPARNWWLYAGTPLLLLAGGLVVRRLRRQPQHGIHSA